jgi:mannosylglycerate synthase
VPGAPPSLSSPQGRARSAQGPRTLIVIPVLNEDLQVVGANLQAAADHPRVHSVIAVTGDHDSTNRQIRKLLPMFGKKVRAVPQERIGSLRAGKGDAINTGLKVFLEDPMLERIHFYDADIRTFDGEWITKGENALDLGFQAVRHFYPRAATDAMITWMVTRLGFAILWPRSPLPTIEQPLSGELAFNREAASVIAADRRVEAQSDWGVDTAITFATVAHGLSVYESYIARGKDHALYSSLADIKVMMNECLATLQRLRIDSASLLELPRRMSEPAAAVSEKIAQLVGFDIEATQRLLNENWNPRQELLLADHFPQEVAANSRSWRQWPDTAWMDEETWVATLSILLDRFQPDDQDWSEIAFRLWVGRVLHYTLRIAMKGHAFADSYLRAMIARTVERGFGID